MDSYDAYRRSASPYTESATHDSAAAQSSSVPYMASSTDFVLPYPAPEAVYVPQPAGHMAVSMASTSNADSTPNGLTNPASAGSPGDGSPMNPKTLSGSKRAEQNRRAQRAFRERRDAHIKHLEARSSQLDIALAQAEESNRRWEEARAVMDQLRAENAILRAALQEKMVPLPPIPVARPAAPAPVTQPPPPSQPQEDMDPNDGGSPAKQKKRRRAGDEEPVATNGTAIPKKRKRAPAPPSSDTQQDQIVSAAA